jgi:hypothetical protein
MSKFISSGAPRNLCRIIPWGRRTGTDGERGPGEMARPAAGCRPARSVGLASPRARAGPLRTTGPISSLARATGTAIATAKASETIRQDARDPGEPASGRRAGDRIGSGPRRRPLQPWLAGWRARCLSSVPRADRRAGGAATGSRTDYDTKPGGGTIAIESSRFIHRGGSAIVGEDRVGAAR